MQNSLDDDIPNGKVGLKFSFFIGWSLQLVGATQLLVEVSEESADATTRYFEAEQPINKQSKQVFFARGRLLLVRVLYVIWSHHVYYNYYDNYMKYTFVFKT